MKGFKHMSNFKLQRTLFYPAVLFCVISILGTVFSLGPITFVFIALTVILLAASAYYGTKNIPLPWEKAKRVDIPADDDGDFSDESDTPKFGRRPKASADSPPTSFKEPTSTSLSDWLGTGVQDDVLADAVIEKPAEAPPAIADESPTPLPGVQEAPVAEPVAEPAVEFIPPTQEEDIDVFANLAKGMAATPITDEQVTDKEDMTKEAEQNIDLSEIAADIPVETVEAVEVVEDENPDVEDTPSEPQAEEDEIDTPVDVKPAEDVSTEFSLSDLDVPDLTPPPAKKSEPAVELEEPTPPPVELSTPEFVNPAVEDEPVEEEALDAKPVVAEADVESVVFTEPPVEEDDELDDANAPSPEVGTEVVTAETSNAYPVVVSDATVATIAEQIAHLVTAAEVKVQEVADQRIREIEAEAAARVDALEKLQDERIERLNTHHEQEIRGHIAELERVKEDYSQQLKAKADPAELKAVQSRADETARQLAEAEDSLQKIVAAQATVAEAATTSSKLQATSVLRGIKNTAIANNSPEPVVAAIDEAINKL